MLTIAVASFVTYISLLNLRPQIDSDPAIETLHKTQFLFQTFQNYYKIYGRWPGRNTSDNCSHALLFLQSTRTSNNFEQMFLVRGVSDINAYGKKIEVYCESDISLQPLIIQQEIPLDQLDYFRSFFP